MRRLLLTALSVCGMISAAQAQVTFTCIGGTNFGEGEGCDKAFDSNLGTKWGMYSTGNKFAVVMASEPIYVTGYTLVNANDNLKYNRDIKEWEIWGTNNESTARANTQTTDGWTLFERVREHNIGKADYAAHHFAINRPSLAYKYIMFKRVAGSGNDTQLSEICLSYKTQQQKGYTSLSCPKDHQAHEGADKMFDDSWNSKLCVNPDYTLVNYYVTFETDKAVKVSAINMSTANDSDGRDPKQWTLSGSSDGGKTWKDIYIHNGEDLPKERKTPKTFPVVGCDTEYSLFKLEISETRDGNKEQKMQVSELSLNTDAGLTYTVKEATPGFSDKEGAASLFDGDVESKWCCPNYVETDCYLEFKTNTALTPTGYYFVTANDYSDRDPVAWTLYGTKDEGTTWDVLATKERNVDELPTGRMKFKEYSMTAPKTEYSHYKLLVTGRRGSTSGLIQIGEFGLLTASETSDSYFANNENIYVYEGFGGSEKESVDKMFDGNAETKWCFRYKEKKDEIEIKHPIVAVFGVGHPAKLYGYGMHLANDAPERRPKSWTLQGSNDYSTWTEIDKVVDDSKLPAQNFALAYYPLDAPVEYKYYKLTIDAVWNDDLFQMAEFVPMFDGGTLNKLILKDGVTEFTFNGNATVGELNYERSVTAGNVSTFILPVEVPVEKVNGTVWELATYTGSALKFTKVENGTLAANKPYLVQPTSDKLIADNKLENVRLYAAPGTEGLKKATTDGGAYQMGTYKQLASTDAVTDGTVYGYTGGKFVQATSGTLNPFRTLFVVKEGAEAAAREISLVLGDQETGIVSITKDGEIEDREVDVYDLNGRKVAQSVAGSTCLMNLPAGVYVVNGKKYVIK